MDQRPPLYLCAKYAPPRPSRAYSYSSLFLYGFGANNTTTNYESFNYQGRKKSSYGAIKTCIKKKKKIIFPIMVTVISTLLIPSAGPLVGGVNARQFNSGIWCSRKAVPNNSK